MRSAIARGVLAVAVLLLMPAVANAGLDSLYLSPGISPPGSNKPDCHPPAAHPEPIVLVHGTLLDQVAGSAFMQDLNAGDETPGNVDWTVIETSHDEIVTPYTSAFLPAGPGVTNVLIQNRCKLDLSEHVSIAYDKPALGWVLDALGRPGPADPAAKVSC